MTTKQWWLSIIAFCVAIYFLVSVQDADITVCGVIKNKYSEYVLVDKNNARNDRYLLLDNGALETVSVYIYMKYNIGDHICLIKPNSRLVWSWNKK